MPVPAIAGNWQLATGNFLAVGFVTPAFAVAGILLASIPIVIHILNRRRFKTVDWAAMAFLLQALRKNRRRLRFEQWLLLAVRCCVLLFLGLALARPLGCADATLANFAAQRSGLYVLIIDNSYSMAYEADRPDARTHLDQAKLLARKLIDQFSGGESVAIITSARPAAAVIAKPTYDLESAKSAVERIEQSYGDTDLLGAMQHALDIGREHATQPVRKLYIFSDSTRSAWEAAPAAALAAMGKDMAGVYELTHFNLSLPGQWNHAVLDVRPAANLVRSHFDNPLQAVVRGYGSDASATLQWRLDDQPLPGGGVIQPQPTTPPQTQTQAQIRQGGLHTIAAAIAGENRLRIDDVRWRVIDVASELKVLIVEGERGIGPLAGSGAFLQLALSPANEDAGQRSSYVLPEVISDLELGNKVLGDYRAILLTGVPQISAQQADQMRSFVEQGGTVMWFMGEAVNADAYNQILLPRGLMPGTLARRLNVAGDGKPFAYDFKPYGATHPLLGVFQNQEKTGLDVAQVFTYWQVELPKDATVQRVLDYLPDEKGRRDPAITVHDLGQGRVVFFSTSAGPEWTTLPAKPAYVALMHELLAGNVTAADRWLNKAVGQTLEIPSTVQLTAVPTLTDPTNMQMPLEQVQTTGGRSAYRSAALDRPGVYWLATGNRTMPVAVNVPDNEADIRPLDAAAIRAALGGVEISTFDDQLPPRSQSHRSGNDFGWSVMAMVLALVGLECFLAMKFGHYRR